LTGWRISRGVDFTFPSVTLAAGAYLVVAADMAAFNAKYPGVANVVGGWRGTLSNQGEEVEIEDALGNNVDSVEYADEGDWAIRVRTNPIGWRWLATADGGGASLELCNPALPGNNGQNWKASLTGNGTPGAQNSNFTNNIPPLALDLRHFPVVPKSTDSITFTVRIQDEQTTGLTVTLRHRDHTTTNRAPVFSSTPMLDNGTQGDGAANDGIYGAVLPPQPHGTVIEYYVEATDAGGRTRTWPAAALQGDQSFAQTCNAHLQVDDEVYVSSQPAIRLILTAVERQQWVVLAQQRNPNVEVNATLIVVDGSATEVRHNCGLRYRGASSLRQDPPTMRLNVPKDRLWNNRSEYNLNSRYGYCQVLGAAMAAKAGMPAAQHRAVQLRVNGVNWGVPGEFVFDDFITYGSYVLQESMNGDWAEDVFPDDSGGNVYRCARPDTGLYYLGTNPNAYRNQGYSKESNTSEDNWDDLINLTFVLNNAPDNTYVQQVRQVANVEKWMVYFAACQLMEYSETALCNGGNGTGMNQSVGDDYSMYRGVMDPRFVLMGHDFDTVFGQGDTAGQVMENIFQMTTLPVLDRFMKRPEFTAVYYRTLKHLAETAFAPEQFDPFVDYVLGEYVPTTTIDAIKDFNVRRRNHVLSQIPLSLTINVGLNVVNGYFQTTSGTISLTGQANVIETYSIRVNGAPAQWVPWQRTWTANGVALQPGLNTVTV